MVPKTWTIGDLLKVTGDFLHQKGIDSPRPSAEILLAHHLGVERIDLYLHLDKPLHEGEVTGYRALIRRRLKREPLQYITGRQEFWSMEFSVGPGALIPRPESELLVEEALRLLRDFDDPGKAGPRILDLGTGSGALVLALGKELPKASLWASDVSEEALRFARENAKRHGLDRRIEFLRGDLFSPLKERGLTFDLIVTNPPYIASEGVEKLMPEVSAYEPRVALDGGPGGMAVIQRIIREAWGYLNPRGWLLVEMDPEQTQTALALIERIEHYGERRRTLDYTRRYRVVIAQKAVG